MPALSRGRSLGSCRGGSRGNDSVRAGLSSWDVTGTRVSMQPLELWGGHEPTVNRVGDAVFDQTVRSGHHERLDDLDRFAELGLKALRYPVLWERIAPERPDAFDWAWTDARLPRIRELG